MLIDDDKEELGELEIEEQKVSQKPELPEKYREKSLQFRKGELSILIWLKNLKQVSERAFEDLNEKNV